MNKTLKAILQSRSDLSPYLFHFTKGSNAVDTLLKIISDRKLKGSSSNGVVCFTESPLTSMDKLFDIFNKYSSPMFAPYGIAIERDKLFSLGCRPVIYGQTNEKALLDPSIQWRFEPYAPGSHDFTWLREWRIKGDVSLDPNDIFIITKEDQELSADLDGLEVVIDGDVADGEWLDQSYAYGIRYWKTISLKSMRELSMLSDHEIKEIVGQQNIGDTYGV